MAVDRRASVLLLSLYAGCTSSSIGSDVRTVRELGSVQRLPVLRDEQVELDTSDEAKALLGAPLDADAAVRVALANNRELRARLRELGVARGRLMQAGTLVNPTVEVELSPERQSDFELRVEYQVTSLIMAPLRKRAEERELSAARYAAAGDVVELGYRVRIAFYAMQAAQQRLELAQQTLDVLAAGRDAAQALREAGSVPALDASVQIAAYERARIGAAELELELAERREGLQRLLGLYGQDASWMLALELGPVPEDDPGLEHLETRALEANLDLRAAQERLVAIGKRTGIARVEGLLPDVTFDVHSLHASPDDGDAGRDVRWGGGISVEVPLFDREQGTRRSYEAAFDGLLERTQGLAIDLRSAAREARSRVISAHARAKQYETVIVPAQRTVLEQSLLQYNAMQLSVFQLLEARRELLEVELAYVDTLREYWSAHAEIEALLQGRRVGTSEAPVAAPASAGSLAVKGGH